MYKVLFCSFLLWSAQIISSLGTNNANQPLPIVISFHLYRNLPLILFIYSFTKLIYFQYRSCTMEWVNCCFICPLKFRTKKSYRFNWFSRRHLLFFIQFGLFQNISPANAWRKFIREIDTNRQKYGWRFRKWIFCAPKQASGVGMRHDCCWSQTQKWL